MFAKLAASSIFNAFLKVAPYVALLFALYSIVGYIEEKKEADIRNKLLEISLLHMVKSNAAKDKILEDDAKQARLNSIELGRQRELEYALSQSIRESDKASDICFDSNTTIQLRKFWN